MKEKTKKRKVENFSTKLHGVGEQSHFLGNRCSTWSVYCWNCKVVKLQFSMFDSLSLISTSRVEGWKKCCWKISRRIANSHFTNVLQSRDSMAVWHVRMRTGGESRGKKSLWKFIIKTNDVRESSYGGMSRLLSGMSLMVFRWFLAFFSRDEMTKRFVKVINLKFFHSLSLTSLDYCCCDVD